MRTRRWDPRSRSLVLDAAAWAGRRVAIRGLLGATERFLVVVTFIALSSAVLPLVRTMLGLETTVYEGTSVLLPLYVFFTALALLRPRAVIQAARRSTTLLVLVGIAVLSVTWSDAPTLTLRRVLVIIATTTFGLYLTARFDQRELLRLLSMALGSAALLSFLWSLSVPRSGVLVAHGERVWVGIFGNKNVLGRCMVLSTALFFLRARMPSGRILSLAAAALSMSLVVLSRSASAIVVLSALLALIPMFILWSSRNRLAIAMLIMAVVVLGTVSLLLVANSEVVLTALGKEPTLTGRTELWEAVWSRILERPWLGYGYEAFWTGWKGASAAVLEAVGWETPHAHNGVLDLWLSLGFIGVATFAVSFVAAVGRAIAAAQAGDSVYAIWPLVFLSFMLFYNMTESTILRQHSVFWVLYVATVTQGSVNVQGPRRGLRPGARAGFDVAKRALSLSLGVRRRWESQSRASPNGPPNTPVTQPADE
jgi:exopolysaccharide production protein ExoQ